jgi:hypothetical protein
VITGLVALAGAVAALALIRGKDFVDRRGAESPGDQRVRATV